MKMYNWETVRELGIYLGLDVDGTQFEKLSSHSRSEEFLDILRLSVAGPFRNNYPAATADLIVNTIFGMDLGMLANSENEMIFSREVFRKLRGEVLQGEEAAYNEAFGEFDVVFQRFIRSFKAAFEGISYVLGLKKEPISLENTGVKEYLSELKELPCRKLGELSFAYRMHGGTALSEYTETLLKKYEDKAITAENCRMVMEIMNKVAGYPGYFKTMGAEQKLIESRPLLLALSELQLYEGKENAKKDLLSILSILLFNVFPTPKLLKFVTKFEPGHENDALSYEYYSILSLNYMLSGKLTEAVTYNEKALNCAMDEEKRAYTYIMSSCIYLNRKDFNEAVRALYNCASLTRDARMRATAHFYMGIVYYEMGSVPEALDCFINASVGLEDELDVMNVYNNIGICAMLRGDMKNAVNAFENVDRAGRYMSSNSAKFLKSVAYGSLGIVHMSMRNNDLAVDYYKEALKLDRDIHDKKRAAYQLGNIGLALKSKQDYKHALEYFKSSLSVSFDDDYPEGVLFSFGQIEQMLAMEGKYEETETFKRDIIRRNPGIAKMLRK